MSQLKVLFFALITCLFVGCSEGPGPLEGTWKMSGMPITVTYREGEEESLGLISKVTYEHKGNDVLVTYVDGLAKGTTMRISMKGRDKAVTGMGTLTRIKN